MLKVSEVASREFESMLASMPEPRPRLRVFIERRCPCGNVHFSLSLEHSVSEADREFAVEGLPFVTDAETLSELAGVEIDYQRDWMRQGFTVRNLNHSCGGHI